MTEPFLFFLGLMLGFHWLGGGVFGLESDEEEEDDLADLRLLARGEQPRVSEQGALRCTVCAAPGDYLCDACERKGWRKS